MVQGEEGSPSAFKKFVDVYRLPILLGGVSLLCIAFSLIVFVKSYEPTAPIRFSSDEQQATVAGVVTDRTVVVDIEGAVNRPGVYELPHDSRVRDAIEKAGGFSSDVDMEAVSKSMNQASVLLDGAKIFVPKVGESSASETVGSVSMGINVNTASQSELEALPGVGPVTAGKIISGRPYTRLEELVEKKALSQNLYEKLKNQLIL